jgi:hypothetical protein
MIRLELRIAEDKAKDGMHLRSRDAGAVATNLAW